MIVARPCSCVDTIVACYCTRVPITPVTPSTINCKVDIYVFVASLKRGNCSNATFVVHGREQTSRKIDTLQKLKTRNVLL